VAGVAGGGAVTRLWHGRKGVLVSVRSWRPARRVSIQPAGGAVSAGVERVRLGTGRLAEPSWCGFLSATSAVAKSGCRRSTWAGHAPWRGRSPTRESLTSCLWSGTTAPAPSFARARPALRSDMQRRQLTLETTAHAHPGNGGEPHRIIGKQLGKTPFGAPAGAAKTPNPLKNPGVPSAMKVGTGNWLLRADEPRVRSFKSGHATPCIVCPWGDLPRPVIVLPPPPAPCEVTTRAGCARRLRLVTHVRRLHHQTPGSNT
jgi:hypothetical protein